MRYWVFIAGAALGCGGNAKFSSEPPAATAGTSAAAAGVGATAVGGSAAGGSAAGGSAAGGSAAGGSAAGGSASCEASPELRLADATAHDADGDGLFEQLETVRVGAWLENLSGTDLEQVGIRVSPDDAAVEPESEPTRYLERLPAGGREWLDVAFVPPMSFSSGSEIGFRIEPIGLAGASCVAPSSTNLTVTLENFAGELPICPTIRQFSLSEPRLFDASGDGRIEPGEDFTLSVTLTNPGPLDFNWYPGVMLSTDNPSVSGQYDDWRFAIAAGSSETHLARLHADASLPRGTTVMLTLHAAALNVACQNQPTLEYTILVE